MSNFESDERERDYEDDERGPRRGIFGSAKHLLHRLVSLLHNRAELFTTELQEELTRLVGILLCAFAGMQFLVIGLTFLAIASVLFIPEPVRKWMALGLGVLFLLLTGVAAIVVVKIIKAKSRPFDATLTELAKDRERLKDRD